MKKGRKRWVIRGLAVFLVVVMVFSYWASALVNIKIADDTSDAAVKYLAENTEYVQKTRAARTWELVKSLKETNDPGSYYLQASIKIGSGEYDEALLYINKCLEYWTSDRDTKMYISLMTKKGCLQTLLDQNDEAVETLEKVVAISSEQSDVYMVLAQIYYEQNDIVKLEEALNQYLRLVPEDIDMRVSYSQTLLAEGKRDEAKAQLAELIKSEAEESIRNDAAHSLALLLIEQQNYSEAEEYLNELMLQEDVYEDIHYDLAVCYMATGELDKAIDHFSQSMEKKYNVQYCSYSRAVCELAKENGNYEQAYLDLVTASEYQEEDKDEETKKLAEELLTQAFVTN